MNEEMYIVRLSDTSCGERGAAVSCSALFHSPPSPPLCSYLLSGERDRRDKWFYKRASADIFHRAHHVRLCIGTRVSEFVTMTSSDIEKANRVVNIIVGKGGGDACVSG